MVAESIFEVLDEHDCERALTGLYEPQVRSLMPQGIGERLEPLSAVRLDALGNVRKATDAISMPVGVVFLTREKGMVEVITAGTTHIVFEEDPPAGLLGATVWLSPNGKATMEVPQGTMTKFRLGVLVEVCRPPDPRDTIKLHRVTLDILAVGTIP